MLRVIFLQKFCTIIIISKDKDDEKARNMRTINKHAICGYTRIRIQCGADFKVYTVTIL